jgi:hypothetical protein
MTAVWCLKSCPCCCLQVYDQIYNNFDPNKDGVGSAPMATNYTSPILHNAIIPNLKANTQCGLAPTAISAAVDMERMLRSICRCAGTSTGWAMA